MYFTGGEASLLKQLNLKNKELFWREVLEHAGGGSKSTTSIPIALTGVTACFP